MSSRQNSIDRPSPLCGKPPAIDYSSRPRIGNMSSSTPPETTSATGAVQENASTAASSSVARGGLIDDYDMSSARPAVAAARTNWNVEDGALRPLPPLHPPLDPASTAFVCDASPSVIAARVSDCLRERSIMTEFDDDAVSQKISCFLCILLSDVLLYFSSWTFAVRFISRLAFRRQQHKQSHQTEYISLYVFIEVVDPILHFHMV